MATLIDLYNKSIKQLNNPNRDEIDIRSLLCHINRLINMSDFYIKKDEDCLDEELFNTLLKKYLVGIPMPYLINKATFLGDDYYVDNRVLIPRCETEEVAMFAVKKIKEVFGDAPVAIADICTGSGCLGIGVAKRVNCKKLYLSDISREALNVAEENAKRFKDELPTVSTRVDDCMMQLVAEQDFIPDVIVSNPPYIIDKSNVDKSVLDYEPHLALFTSEFIEAYRTILFDSSKIKKSPLIIVFEISDEVYPLIKDFIKTRCPNFETEYIKDLNGHWRAVFLKK